ncbi:hypothetical protein FO519_000253 [Halicephalobus sp. NKZ332]|nr:hypothetical protein FO519_000253 [Halicephalobus sp. NKZ332]
MQLYFLTFFCLLGLAFGLQCYEGRQRWDPEPVINNVTLIQCGHLDNCCYMVSSLDGTEYGCYSDCPEKNYFSCGPDPKLGVQDIHYCYCNSHLDANCRPYLGEPQRA